MFIGHFGVGLGAKSIESKTSLAMLFIATQFIDLLWPTLLLLNIEHVEIKPGITKVAPLDFIDYPISHSLLMVVVWGILLSFIYFILTKNKKGSVLIGLLVISHWLLDLIVHLPDLPLAPGYSEKVGLGLWNSFLGTLLLEMTIFLIGAYFYLKNTIAKNKIGNYGIWALLLLLVLIHVGNLFGPIPAHTHEVAWGAQMQWLLVVIAYWIDKNRMSKNNPLKLQPIK